MAIFIPKGDADGSGLGLSSKRWTKLHVSSSYVSSSYINGSEVSSGSQGLMVDGYPILTSPFHVDSLPSIGSNQVALRLNNLLPADGNYSLGGNAITNAAYPTSDSDVANKLYVDNAVQGIKWKPSAKAASEPVGTSYFVQYEQATYSTDEFGNVTFTDPGTPGWDYASGSAGDGATLTFKIPKTSINGNGPGSNINDGNWTWKSDTGGGTTSVSHADNLFDGVDNLVVGERILIKNFVDPYKGRNGIYEVFATGSGTSTLSPKNPILRRVVDFNSGSEVASAAVSVEEGNLNEDIAFVCTTDSDTVSGQDLGDYAIEFSVFGTQTSDGITIYKDVDQNNRFEVTGVLRDINDIFYDYTSGNRNFVSDGVFLVGNGDTFVAESGNTARTSLGLGTGDSPTFNSLTLTDALTSSLLISNAGEDGTIEFKSRLSGTQPITASHIKVTNDVDAGSLKSRGTITATNNISSTSGDITTVNGDFTTTGGSFTTINGDFTSTNGKVDVPFVTASVALSASQILLPALGGTSDLPAGQDITSNYIYNINGRLFFNGGAISGEGGQGVDTMAFQNHENVFIHGGNIYSDAPATDETDRFVRIGVSGSNLDGTYAGTTDRQPGLRIVEGSFIYLSASNAEISGSYGQFDILSGTSADIDGGTIDGTNIGLSVQAIGSFTELTASSADINGGTIDNTVIGGTTPAAGNFTTVDINGGTIDGTNITVGATETLNVSAGTLTLADGQVGANKVGAGTFDAGIYTFDVSSQVTASHVEITNLDVAALTASDVDINGGVLSNVIIDETCTIQVDNADYNNLTASHMKIKDSLDFTLTGSQQSNISGSNLIVQGQSLTFNVGVFENELTASSADINGGTIDGARIGYEASTFGSFTELSSSDGILSASHVKFGGDSGGDIQIKGNTSERSFVDVQFVTGAYAKTKEVLEINGILTASVGPLDSSPGEVTFDFARNRLRNIATIQTGSTGNSAETYRYDSVTRDYLDTVITQKISVDTVATSNKNIGSVAAGDTINNHQLAANDRILLKDQSTASENGIYVLLQGGGLTRAHDLPEGARASGVTVFVIKGDFAGSAFICDSSKNADIVETNSLNFISAGGVINAGSGLDKNVSNNTLNVSINEGENTLAEADNDDRINLSFNSLGKLVLSSSIQTDKARFDLALSSSNVAFTGGDIDDTTIGGTTPAAGTFTNLLITNELSASDGATPTLKFTRGEFDDLEVYGALETQTLFSERLVHISGTLQLERKANAPSDKTDRIYNKDGNLYWQQTLLASESGESEFASLYVTGSAEDGHGAFISGTLIVGEEDFPGVDVFAFISGAIGSKDGSERGVTVLGGDTVVSGNLYLGNTLLTAGGNPAADDIDEGDDAVNITTSTGNVTVKSGPGDDLILTGSDLTLDADTNITVGTNLIPDAAGQHNLGSASREWNELYLGDSGNIKFGLTQDVELKRSASPTTGLTLESKENTRLTILSGYGNPQGAELQLKHESPSPAANDTIGKVDFYGWRSASQTDTLYGRINVVANNVSTVNSQMNFLVAAAGGPGQNAFQIAGDNSNFGVTKVSIPGHNGSTGGLVLGSTLVTSTAAELNILDGATVTATELNLLDESVLIANNVASGSSLRFDGANLQWEEFAGGGGGSATSLVLPDSSTPGNLASGELKLVTGSLYFKTEEYDEASTPVEVEQLVHYGRTFKGGFRTIHCSLTTNNNLNSNNHTTSTTDFGNAGKRVILQPLLRSDGGFGCEFIINTLGLSNKDELRIQLPGYDGSGDPIGHDLNLGGGTVAQKREKLRNIIDRAGTSQIRFKFVNIGTAANPVLKNGIIFWAYGDNGQTIEYSSISASLAELRLPYENLTYITLSYDIDDDNWNIVG